MAMTQEIRRTIYLLKQKSQATQLIHHWDVITKKVMSRHSEADFNFAMCRRTCNTLGTNLALLVWLAR